MPAASTREFHPELLSRREEWTAWALALAVGLALLVLERAGSIPLWVWIFWGFLLFSGASISLGNWMDRRTILRLGSDSLHFENGLRVVSLAWSAVREVTVLPARFGRTVRVRGDSAHFEFMTLGELRIQGQVRGRTGFADGQLILDDILSKTRLDLVEKSKDAYYYARG